MVALPGAARVTAAVRSGGRLGERFDRGVQRLRAFRGQVPADPGGPGGQAGDAQVAAALAFGLVAELAVLVEPPHQVLPSFATQYGRSSCA